MGGLVPQLRQRGDALLNKLGEHPRLRKLGVHGVELWSCGQPDPMSTAQLSQPVFKYGPRYHGRGLVAPGTVKMLRLLQEVVEDLGLNKTPEFKELAGV